MLVGEQLEEAPDLFRQAGVALQQGEGGEEHLVRDAQEAAQQRLLESHAREVRLPHNNLALYKTPHL